MKVHEVKLDNNKTIYLLVNDNELPIIPVTKYLKYIDKGLIDEQL